MLKAIFLDMDETLCDTKGADNYATEKLAEQLSHDFAGLDAALFTRRYVAGFYKQLNHEFPHLVALLPNEQLFRQALIKALFSQQQIQIDDHQAASIQDSFNQFRFAGLDFFPGTQAMLQRLRQRYKLIVITNGPTFSQRPKIAKLGLEQYVDHIVVGGEEPEEKPALSIFAKALRLAGCQTSEALHVGDSFACDVVGAHNANISSIWLAPLTEQAHNPQASLATYCISGYAQIEQTIWLHEKNVQQVLN